MATKKIRRDQVKPGMIVHSSHGYKLSVTRVIDTAQNRTDDRHVEIRGFLYPGTSGVQRNERYPAGSMVEVEVPDGVTVTFDATDLAALADCIPAIYNSLTAEQQRNVQDLILRNRILRWSQAVEKLIAAVKEIA